MSKTKRRRMLETLAYGSDNDAIAMMFMLGKPGFQSGDLDGLDLSRVTAVSHGKDGSVSVSFVDRYRALQALENEGTKNPTSEAIYAALRKSCQEMEMKDEPEDDADEETV